MNLPQLKIISSKVMPNEVRDALNSLARFFGQASKGGGLPTREEMTGAIADQTGQGFAIPPAPIGFIATGAFAMILLEWDKPTFAGFAYTEIFRATVDDLGQTVKVATSIAPVYADTPPSSSLSITYYYWIRHVNQNNLLGPYNQVAGTPASTASDPAYVRDLMLAQLGYENGIFPVRPVDALPSLPDPLYPGDCAVFLRPDGPLYWNVNNVWVSKIPAVTVTGQLTETQISDNAISTPKISAGAVEAAKIAAGAVTAEKIAATSVVAGKIAAGAIVAGDGVIANAAITNAHIVDATITGAKIGTAAIDSAHIATAAIVAAKIGTAAVTNAKIQDAAISNAKIQYGAITNAKIGTAAVTNAKIQDAAITNAKIGTAAVTSAKIQNAAISSAKIGTAEVGTLKLEGQAVTIPVNAYTGGTVALPKDIWTTVQTAVITSSGAPIVVIVNVQGYAETSQSDEGDKAYLLWRLQRDGVTINNGPARFRGSATIRLDLSRTMSETPGSGTRTYTLQLWPTATFFAAAEASERSIFLLEVKR